MVHTNPNAVGRFFHYYNMPSPRRIEHSRRRNPSYQERFRSFAHRPILVERGLDLSRVNNARAQQIAVERGWQGFIQNPDSYDPALVLEFYAAMIPPTFKEFSTVIVRNQPIRMTNEDICNYFGVARYEELDATFGIPPIPGVRHDETHSPIIARSLRQNGRERWEARRAEIRKSEMEPGLGLWLLFVKGSLAPSSHYTTVNPYVARLMYCIQNNLPLDIGHIIRLHMIDAAAENCQGVLPFPCLITQFCRNAGIETGNTIPAFAPYNHTAYRLQLAAVTRLAEAEANANERMDIPQGVDDNDADDADYDPVQDGGHQPTVSDARGNERMEAFMEEVRAGFARMERGFRHLGVPDRDEPEPAPAQRRRRRQNGESSSTRRRNRN